MNLLLFFGDYFLYLVGFAAQVLLQAQTSISSNSNGLNSVRDWVKLHAPELLPRLLLALGLAPAVVMMVPDTGNFPATVIYFLGGFFADRIITSLLFMYGQKLGTKIDTPQLAPPPGEKDQK